MTEAHEQNAVDPLVGTSLAGKYKIVRLLGEGGMGCVYLGEQGMGSGVRKVAIKTLHTHLSHDEKIRTRFMRECGTVAELEHPNTIQVFDFGTTDNGTLYIVMEFVSGKSLADVLEQEGPLSPTRAAHVLHQICGSLEEAHKRGIVHRDLKPENIILCEKAGQADWVKVLDFGIAKRSSETDPNEAKLTQQGTVLGTPPYMSPEQFTGKPIDSRSDIYSLGIVAYQMLTGDLPFTANTAWEWATQHMTVQPKPIDATPVAASIPVGAREAVMHALAKDPAARFDTMREFDMSLSRGFSGPLGHAPEAATTQQVARTELAMPVMSPTGPQAAAAPSAFGAPPAVAVPPPAARTPGSNKGLLLGLVGAGMLALGGGGYALSHSAAPVRPAPVVAAPVSTPAPATANAPVGGSAAPVADAPLPELGDVPVQAPVAAASGKGGKASGGAKVLTPVPPAAASGAPAGAATSKPPVTATAPAAGPQPALKPPARTDLVDPFQGKGAAVPAMPGLVVTKPTASVFCTQMKNFPVGSDPYRAFEAKCKAATGH